MENVIIMYLSLALEIGLRESSFKIILKSLIFYDFGVTFSDLIPVDW